MKVFAKIKIAVEYTILYTEKETSMNFKFSKYEKPVLN